MKFVFHEMNIETKQNNLTEWDEKLGRFTGEFDCYYFQDLTDDLSKKVAESGIKNGTMVAQVMHTTCVLSVNELDEPMLLGDISRYLEKSIPKVSDYLHNSPLRTVNLCADDHKCDRNADAHIKSFLVGNHTATLLVRDGALVLGRWQRLSLVDFDGPRPRKLMVQISGE